MKTPRFVAPALRVSSALILCAACFQAGRWYQELSIKAHPGNEMVSATHAGPVARAPGTVEVRPLVAAGDPPGEGGDIITPLNVRDPSALVMGPGPEFNRPAPPPAPPEAAEPRVSPMPRAKMKAPLESGRLLELLKRGDKNTDAPKRF